MHIYSSKRLHTRCATQILNKNKIELRPSQPTTKLKLKPLRTAVLGKFLGNFPCKTKVRARTVFKISENCQNLEN